MRNANAAVLIAVVLSAASLARAEAPQVRLAIPGFQGVNVEPKFMEFFTEELAEQLTKNGLKVVTAREIATLMGLERQRELVGCAETASSCMAEIGNALGADGIVLGSIARIGKAYQVNIKIVNTNSGDRVGTYTQRVESEEKVLDALEDAGRTLSSAAVKALLKEAPRERPEAVATQVEAPEQAAAEEAKPAEGLIHPGLYAGAVVDPLVREGVGPHVGAQIAASVDVGSVNVALGVGVPGTLSFRAWAGPVFAVSESLSAGARLRALYAPGTSLSGGAVVGGGADAFLRFHFVPQLQLQLSAAGEYYAASRSGFAPLLELGVRASL